MKTLDIRILLTGLFFILMITTGIWLTRTGKPYHPVLFNVHKLAALITVVFAVIVLYRHQKRDVLSILEWLFIVFAGLFILTSFVTGALLSLEKTMPQIILTIHKISPILISVFAALVVYFTGFVK